MADIESQLAALEDKAPVTPEPGDDSAFVENVYVPENDAGEEQVATDDAEKAGRQRDDLPYEEIKKRADDLKGAMAKEREARRRESARAKAAEQQLAEERARVAAWRAQLEAQMNPAPDPEVDVVGYAKHLAAQLEAQRQRDADIRMRQQAQQQQVQFVEELRGSVEDYEAEFKQQAPDYDAATDFLLSAEQERLEMLGYDRDTAARMTEAFAINSARMMLAQGRNPAETAYALAKRMGYRPASPAQAQPPAAGKLAQVRAGQRANSPMNGGGSGSGGSPSLKTILGLTGAAGEAAREKWLSDMISGKAR